MADTVHRKCDGCGNVDDAPRIVYVAPGGEERLFHYDCAPAYVVEELDGGDDHPGRKATAAGKRGDQVRKAVEAHVKKNYVAAGGDE